MNYPIRTAGNNLRAFEFRRPCVYSLLPPRLRTFTFRPDPDFEAKWLDMVGLYLHPPAKALVLCGDEKTGMQALDRTPPLLPLRAKQPRSWTNEDVRHGSPTLRRRLSRGILC